MTRRESEWAALMRAANAGDGQAYARLLNEVAPVLRGIVRSRARGQPADLHEDVLQEILMAIHIKRHTWDPQSPLLPWLYAISRHKVIDAYRRRRREVHLPIEEFCDAFAAPEQDVTAARDSARLLAMIDARSAEIVRAIALKGDSAAEVGQRLTMSEGSVRVALHRALDRLSRLAGGKGGAR
ncbi:sigma-70 family RNA polymerase sigma factor [Paracoccus sp. MBLB3053]|uniref:Sigma-70 family RNA polymerase sigma factor n=1 Tax=Paracoccus aurantius TaxID=3073814 RepID=A0ABU2HWM5_9RHOB|nr:sigma-70 family RNA polymerase sigma factor [Paracoccus sp. MBLB3053]MDS9468965.1 sigma-70 family RNA polymerase sigma factor [Paracoccus sp. MBLB3053]